MSLPIVFRPEAETDVLEARDWYEQQRPGLGAQFADALDELMVRIESQPMLYAPAHADVRRVKLKRFPYVVYYRVLADHVEVIAVLHGSREPRVWQSRS